MHGVTKPVTFDITFEGQLDDLVGFSGQTNISRKEFGVTWNPTIETGGVVVKDNVKINLDIQAKKQFDK